MWMCDVHMSHPHIVFYLKDFLLIVTRRRGVAKKIEEYVPAIMPMANTSAKSCVAELPKKNKASNTKSVVRDVFIARAYV